MVRLTRLEGPSAAARQARGLSAAARQARGPKNVNMGWSATLFKGTIKLFFQFFLTD